MQQIRKLELSVKILAIEYLYACYLRMVRSADKRWNHFSPDILHLQQELERLGLECHNGNVRYAPLEDGNV